MRLSLAAATSYLGVGIPGALDLWVELTEKRCHALGARLAKAALVQEEVDAQISLVHRGLVVNDEAANAWARVSLLFIHAGWSGRDRYLAGRGS